MSFPSRGGFKLPYVKSSGSLVKPVVGDVWAVITPTGIEPTSLKISQNRGSGYVDLTMVGATHTVDANDIMPVGSANWPVIARDIGPLNLAGKAQSVTNPPSVPGAPTIGTATAGDGQAGVAFTAPASDGGAAITSYLMYANGSDGSVLGPQTAVVSPMFFTGLTNGVTYTFRVLAINSVGPGPLSAASNAVTPSINPVATPLIATPTTIGVASTYTTPDTVLSQQWTLDGVDAAGAINSTYTEAFTDAEKLLRVRVSTAAGNATSLPTLPGMKNVKFSNTVNLRAGLAGAVRSTWLVIGDSYPQGHGSGGSAQDNSRANSFFAQASTLLSSAGIPVSKDSACGSGLPSTTAAVTLMDPRLTFAGAANILANYPTLGGNMFRISSSGDKVTFTPGSTFDTVDIMYAVAPSGQGAFGVGVNGGASLQTVPNVGTEETRIITVSVPAGSTSVSMLFSSGVAVFMFIQTRTVTVPKIELINAAVSSMRVYTFAAPPGTGQSSWNTRACLPALLNLPQKTVVFFDGWSNDRNDGQTLAQIQANFRLIINQIKAAGGDVVYVGYPSLSTTIVSKAIFDTFEQGIVDLFINEYDAPVLQMSRTLTDYTTYNALGYYFDPSHMSQTGHAKNAALLTAMMKYIKTITS